MKDDHEKVKREGDEEDHVGSSLTLERVAAAKQYIEGHYKAQMKHIQARKESVIGPAITGSGSMREMWLTPKDLNFVGYTHKNFEAVKGLPLDARRSNKIGATDSYVIMHSITPLNTSKRTTEIMICQSELLPD